MAETRKIERAAIFGASGVIGRQLAKKLIARGSKVRVVARSHERLCESFDVHAVECVAADVSDAAQAIEAARDCDTLFHCVGLPWGEYTRHAAIGRVVGEALRATGAFGVLVSGYWSRTPATNLPITDSHPRPRQSAETTARADQEEFIEAAGGASAILPDFFGPGAVKALINSAVIDVATGREPRWLGRLDLEREFIHVGDAADLLIRLAERRGAGGRSWIFPGSGVTTPRTIIDLACAQTGNALTPSTLTRDELAQSADDPASKAMLDLLPIYDAPATFNASELLALVSDFTPTSYETGVGEVIAWARELDS